MPTQFNLNSKYIVNEKGCWEWTGFINTNGYPSFKREGINGGHKYFYKKYKGEIPEGYQIDHLCKNRACVNPEHLEAVTAQENTHRSLATKLTKEDIMKIKQLKDKYTQRELAEMFYVNQCNISRILNNKRWRYN